MSAVLMRYAQCPQDSLLNDTQNLPAHKQGRHRSLPSVLRSYCVAPDGCGAYASMACPSQVPCPSAMTSAFAGRFPCVSPGCPACDVPADTMTTTQLFALNPLDPNSFGFTATGANSFSVRQVLARIREFMLSLLLRPVCPSAAAVPPSLQQSS